MAKNSELIRRWFDEVWNRGREATIDELCAQDAVGHGQTLDGTDIVGPETFKHFWQTFRSAFTAIHIKVERTIEEGEMVLAQWTLTMQHTGPFLGIEPTGKRITARGMSIQRIVDGKILEAWDNWDQLAVMAQLGAVSLAAISSEKPEERVA
jgi:steroid delta-isomerase-like uncharacterized protein